LVSNWVQKQRQRALIDVALIESSINALLQVVIYGHRIPLDAHIKDFEIACAN